MSNLKEKSYKFEEKLNKIKVALFDCDGVLTDGKLYYQDDTIGFNRRFHAHDGYGMKILMNAGIKVGIISGGNSEGLRKRIENIGLDFAYLGDEDKRSAFLEIRKKMNIQFENMLYIGDDLFDIPLLRKAGFSATVPQASFEVKEVVDYVTSKRGGDGAAREICDMVRFAQNIKIRIPELED